jgi:hypothetical protein
LSNEVLLFKGIYKHSTAGVPALLEKDLAEATRTLKKKRDKEEINHLQIIILVTGRKSKAIEHFARDLRRMQWVFHGLY